MADLPLFTKWPYKKPLGYDFITKNLLVSDSEFDQLKSV